MGYTWKVEGWRKFRKYPKGHEWHTTTEYVGHSFWKAAATVVKLTWEKHKYINVEWRRV